MTRIGMIERQGYDWKRDSRKYTTNCYCKHQKYPVHRFYRLKQEKDDDDELQTDIKKKVQAGQLLS